MSSDLPGMDRREAHRPRFFADVEIEKGQTRMQVRTQDISLEGMLLETDSPLEPGEEFKARVHMKGEPPLEAECMVKRLVPGVGMGVEFMEMTTGDRVRLRKLVQALPH